MGENGSEEMIGGPPFASQCVTGVGGDHTLPERERCVCVCVCGGGRERERDLNNA